MIRRRQDCLFYFFTKRIDRLSECLPPDWGGGYENVIIGCTVENQEMADYRLPIFLALPVQHRAVIAAPLLTPLDISAYLDPEKIDEVSASGESGADARPCHYDWILSLRQQCAERDISFQFHQTGAHFIKDGRMYRVPRARRVRRPDMCREACRETPATPRGEAPHLREARGTARDSSPLPCPA